MTSPYSFAVTPEEYKQWLINKINSGAEDYSYGPGSPGATSSDMKQFVGARDNPLKTGDIALPPNDYKLFSPEERAKYGIADTSFYTPGRPTPPGSVERYYGSTGSPPTVPQEVMSTAMADYNKKNGTGYQFGMGSNTGAMSTMLDYQNMKQSDSQIASAGSVLSKGLQGAASAIGQGTGMQAASHLRGMQHPQIAPEGGDMDTQGVMEILQQMFGSQLGI